MDNEALRNEMLYYAPPSGTGLASEWTPFVGDRQTRYLDYCRKGQDIIADMIIKGRESGHLPTMKQLYQEAAHIRRAIAELSGFPFDSFQQYGTPTIRNVTDELSDAHGSRYDVFVLDAVRRFTELATLIEDGKTEECLGKEYSAKVINLKGYRSICIYHNGVKIAELDHNLQKGGKLDGILYFQHTDYGDRDQLFSAANTHLEKLANGNLSQEDFWKEMGEISLHLFHAAPLRLGSQTATLMVLAGITKAMGYEVVPRKHGTDHFIEAELTPYADYIADYGNRFEHPPRKYDKPQEIEVDRSFIEQGIAKCRARYTSEHTAQAKLEKYILGALSQNVSLSEVSVEEGKVSVKVDPDDLQKQIDSAFNFVGHQHLIDMLGLPEKKKWQERTSETSKGISAGLGA